MLRALFLLFVVLPVVDLIVFFRLGQRFGFLEVVLAAFLIGALGAAMAKREGLRVFERWNRALAEGRAPEEGVVASGLLLLAGLLLLLPGFLSDVLGLLLVLPPVRAWVARLLRARFEADVADGRIEVVGFGAGGPGGPGPSRRSPRRRGDVIDVEGEELSDESSHPAPPRRLPGDPDAR